MQADSSSAIDGDSEDDFDWEEVALPDPGAEAISTLPNPPEVVAGSSTHVAENIEITIKTKPVKDDSAK